MICTLFGRKKILALLLLASFACTMFPQTGSDPGTLTPAPYGPAEFAPWQLDLRRSEIIALGSLPFVTFMASIGYDMYRYFDHDFDNGYLPWPFKKKDIAIPLSEREQINILCMSAGISVSFAAIDFAINTIRRSQTHAPSNSTTHTTGAIRVVPVLPEDSGENELQ
ncbi:MAG TPA: hypothetical protein PKH40_09520 [Treponemataceae bacterium]|jgi:hypothetical protein|nr:MAG: hypothetical protein EWM51_01555 [Treponema sp.]HOC29909.1 hypothetical protein [Treponemataceae bacterium]HPX48732.1 hypothetical protein [Treponemataceae bacterium]HQL33318.1 hypothetical protein [Treponemataceae bacterium]